jgi:hypothetical protein
MYDHNRIRGGRIVEIIRRHLDRAANLQECGRYDPDDADSPLADPIAQFAVVQRTGHDDDGVGCRGSLQDLALFCLEMLTGNGRTLVAVHNLDGSSGLEPLALELRVRVMEKA